MLDYRDPTESALGMVIFKALEAYDDKHLLAWLEDADPILRAAAARELHARPSEKSFSTLATLCRSKRFETREAAAFALSQFGTPDYGYSDKAFDVLGKLLDDDYFEVQAAAVGAIGWQAGSGHQPPKKTLKRILDLSTHPRAEVREAVAYALLSLESKQVEHTLEQLADDANPDVREAAEFCAQARREMEEERVPAE